MKKELTRREFIKDSGKLLVGGGLLLGAGVLIPNIARAAAKKASTYCLGSYIEKYRYAYTVEIDRCIGCGMCAKACKIENNIPDTFFRTWVERYSFLKDGQVVVDSPQGAVDGFKPNFKSEQIDKAFFVPKLCNHCKNPRCVQVCPVGAAYISREGVVLIDKKHCVGCAYCVQACPYGARYIDPSLSVADKCTWCYHRITKGKPPACVLACPRKARKFGEINDPQSEVYSIVRRHRTSELKPEMKTHPQVYYVGLDREVR